MDGRHVLNRAGYGYRAQCRGVTLRVLVLLVRPTERHPMPDLAVVALINAKSGSEDQVRDALTALVAPTRDEAGCISYDLYESTTEPGTFVTVESWKAQEDLDGHMASPHIAATFAAAGDHLASQPAIHVLKPLVAG